MSDDDWDNDDDLDIPKVVIPPVVATGAGQWDDEDADDNKNVQDDWDASDDDSESKPATTAATGTGAGKVVAPPKKKKGLKEAIAQRKAEEERKALEAAEQKEEEDAANYESPEDRKKREEESMREADLQNARDLFGGVAEPESFIDTMKPKTKEEFEKYEKQLVEKISKHEKALAYSQFVENLTRDLCVSLAVDDIKRISSALTVLANEKQKAAKPVAGKKGAKGKPAPVLAKTASSGVDTTNYDDFDDFM
ncbi:translation initiation factor eIF3 subunit [Rhizoclosmatium globosum]|uniref:Eukaryotic translation initiation factor 3 subunit J n=1 Tax=Rhizoclosmatium globosum TaxID=329046 RepID=A0A1Y2CRY8_9FUNG|nr:translation initiation factor eIF3 subunit [Rhizoclosmatium globosum]|eukprot:ORY49820.1 translation initiation factor eIF3 subunit [Rhizoclosmatium globosum]